MKKITIILLFTLCLFLPSCSSNNYDNTNKTASNSLSAKKENKKSKKHKSVYFKSDETVNRFFTKYNSFAEIKIPKSNIEQGNIKTKALVYMDDLSMEIINAHNSLAISIGTSPTNEYSKLYSVFRDTIKSVKTDITEPDIQSAWNAIHETGYMVENYNFNKINITYIPYKELSKGHSNLRIDLDFPINDNEL